MGSPSISNTEKYKMWVKQKYECPLCEQHLKASEIFTPELVNIDHIWPRSRGGTHRRSNLQLTHKLCNDLKADTVPEGAGKAPDAMVTVYSSGERLDAYQVRKHSLWTAQGYLCGICHRNITPSEIYRDELVRIFQKIPPRFGGTRDLTNMHITHVKCYLSVQHVTPYWVIDNLPELGER